MHNQIRLFLLMRKKEQAKREVVSKKRYMLEERCLFLLTSKKEQAIDEYYRQVGEGWLFCGIFAAI